MHNGGRRRLAIAATTVAIVAGLYGTSHLLGRLTGPAGGAETAAEAGRIPPPVTVPAPVTPSGPAPLPPVAAPPRPVAVTQPITGPGRPPLPMIGTGPHGTLSTTGSPYAALTFDDGPDPRWTPAVLALLREYEVKATFCVVGQLVVAYPELVRQIVAGGHTLCNHTWSHDVRLGSRPRAAIRADLRRTTTAIRDVVPGARVSYYRQPGGAWTRRVVQVAAEQGMSSLHWAVDPQDWRRPGAGAITRTVTTDTGAGEIVLLHDGGGERRDTVQALGRILPELVGRVRLDALPAGVDPPRHHGRELPLKLSQI